MVGGLRRGDPARARGGGHRGGGRDLRGGAGADIRRRRCLRGGRHIRRSPGWMAARRPRRRRSRRRPGWPAGGSGSCRLRAGSSATPAAEVDRTNWYLNSWEWAAFRLTGRAARRAPSARCSPTGTSGRGGAGDPPAAVGGRGGLDRRPLTAEAARSARVGRRASRSSPGPWTRSPASTGPGCSTPATRSIRGTSGGLAVYSDRSIDVPGSWVAPAPVAEPLDRGWRDDGDRQGTRLAGRFGARRLGDAGFAPGRSRLRGAGRGRPRVPAVSRRGALADLGSGRARRVRRTDARPRARAPRPGSARGGRSRPATSPLRSSRRGCASTSSS